MRWLPNLKNSTLIKVMKTSLKFVKKSERGLIQWSIAALRSPLERRKPSRLQEEETKS